MARTGITKTMVQEAQQALLRRGENLSIDAIRFELGNTGSKTTIHRFLKELAQEHAENPPEPHSLSEEIRQLVEQLAVRLEQEAWVCVAAEKAAVTQERLSMQTQMQDAKKQIERLTAEHQEVCYQLAQLEQAHTALSQQWQEAELERTCLKQAQQELTVRLEERNQHIESLEEKHQHARNALEHYRQASKEQREQELRRHEAQEQLLRAEIRQLQQSIVIRQDELTALNRLNERLMSESTHLSSELQDQKKFIEQQEQQAKLLEQHNAMLQTETAVSQRQLEQVLLDKVQQGLIIERYQEQLAQTQAKMLQELFEEKNLTAVLRAELSFQQQNFQQQITHLQNQLNACESNQNEKDQSTRPLD